MKLLKRMIVGLLGLIYCFVGSTILLMTISGGCAYAENVEFQIIPKKEEDTKWKANVIELGEKKTSGKFWTVYNQKADSMKLGGRFASGIFNRDSILDYAAYLVKFVANIALVAGSLAVIYAGYLYVTSMYGSDATGKADGAIKWAAIGIAVIIFSYAIMRIVISAFL